MTSIEDKAASWQDTLGALRPTLPEGKSTSLTPDTPRAKSRLKIELSRKGRRGKEATIIYGFTEADDVPAIATRLKTAMGVGGSTLPTEILIQGDRRSQAAELLRAMGYQVGS